MDTFPASQLSISSYKNKKGEKKFQIVINEDMMERLIKGDKELLAFVSNELKK